MIHEKFNLGSRSPTSSLLEAEQHHTEDNERFALRMVKTRQEVVQQLKDRFPGLPF